MGDAKQDQEDDDDHSFYSQPHDFGPWIIDTTVGVLPYVDEADKACKLWKPFMALGLHREHWVERFLGSWSIHGSRVEGHTDRFIETWRSLIAFAWKCDAWQASDWKGGWDREKLFRYLMGFGVGGFLPDDEHLEAVTEKLSGEFERWAGEFLHARESFVALCQLLRRPVRQSFLRAGVQWLAESLPRLEDRAWRDDENVAGWVVALFDDILNKGGTMRWRSP